MLLEEIWSEQSVRHPNEDSPSCCIVPQDLGIWLVHNEHYSGDILDNSLG